MTQRQLTNILGELIYHVKDKDQLGVLVGLSVWNGLGNSKTEDQDSQVASVYNSLENSITLIEREGSSTAIQELRQRSRDSHNTKGLYEEFKTVLDNGKMPEDELLRRHGLHFVNRTLSRMAVRRNPIQEDYRAIQEYFVRRNR